MSPIDRAEAERLVDAFCAGASPQEAMEAAAAVRDGAWSVVTYSPKVFIPLTKLCRDVCHYCTFARPPERGERAYMTIDEVLDVARRGADAGCTEALFTLGDKPELRYRVAASELEAMGCSSTVEYLRLAAEKVLDETGLLPHLNPGVLGADEISTLRKVAPSMGLMLESTSERLGGKGMAHHGSPDKAPAARLAMIDEAGRSKVPFTTGMLIGIGETWSERIDTIDAVRRAHERYGHIQEFIVQNFRAKPATPMHAHPEPTIDDMLMSIALTRLMLPVEVSVQAPPNLAWSDGDLLRYLDAGINDWGGVSPVTIDHVNPEAPWPEIERLRGLTMSKGMELAPRLTVYPRYISSGDWLEPRVKTKVIQLADGDGLQRDLRWHSGMAVDPPDVIREVALSKTSIRREVGAAIDAATEGRGLSEDEIVLLFGTKGAETSLLFDAADELRRCVNGDTVTYVINRNINYTNMCYFRCGFCAFSKGPKSLNLRGDPYLLDLSEVAQRSLEAWHAGATEVCLQGGIHPSFTGDFYVQVVDAIKAVVPDMHIHAFSPLEVWQGAQTKNVSLKDMLWELKDHGLGTLPGTAAEILDDEVRAVICPDKITTAQWEQVARTAHEVGLKMTTTIMFGHADTPRSWARHLLVLRSIQQDTGGFTEFVPLPFVHMAAPIYLKGKARRGPTFTEALKMHAVGRLALHPAITNIQVSWVKMGEEGSRMALQAGCNDLGGTLMDEIISRSAGASHGQRLTQQDMHRIAAAAGRPAAQRTTLYGRVDPASPASVPA